MTDEELRHRLAELVVEALEVGTGKQERDVIDEIFDAFGIDFSRLPARFALTRSGRTELLREDAADRLASAAPSAAALLNEVVRCGGKFVAMLEEVYARLAHHASTTTGTSQTFRLERGGVNEQQLTISPAFIERVRLIQHAVHTIGTGEIDENAIEDFLGWDSSFYGRWPLNAEDGHLLPDRVLSLAWVTSAVRSRASADTGWARTASAIDAARASAGQLIDAAERLVRTRIARLEMLSDTDLEATTAELPPSRPTRQASEDFLAELNTFRTDRVLSVYMPHQMAADLDGNGMIGLRRDLQAVILPTGESGKGTSITRLAGFIAMWRLGLWPELSRPQVEELMQHGPTALIPWLDQVRTSCNQATAWLTDDVFTATGSGDIDSLIESVKEFLNLPLWRQRHLLYEVWVMCATLDACEKADWTVELNGLTSNNGVWVLPVGPARDPVSTLRYRADPAISLDVWREPSRTTSYGVLTPDIAVSTPTPYVRDLLVIEAKDRQKLRLGRDRAQQNASSVGPGARTALAAADRYAAALHPLVTWLCNHCGFRQQATEAVNHGDIWTHIHIAGQFRPGHIPAAFAESVQAALAPPRQGRHS